jgi:hypothetical protein
MWNDLETGEWGYKLGTISLDTTCGSANAMGRNCEAVVAGILLDIRDDTPGEDYSGDQDWRITTLPHHPDAVGDNVCEGINTILSTLLDKTNPQNRPKTFDDFRDAWFISPSYGHEPEMLDLCFEHGVDKTYVCGDANGDGNINIGDAVYVSEYIFHSGPPPDPLEAGDANCDGSINVGDVVYIHNYVFCGGPPPCCP